MDIKDYHIEVYVGSYKNYNEGSLRGGWIKLPVDDEALDRFLKNVVGIGEIDAFGSPNEEIMIQDWNGDLLHLNEKCEDIYFLNDIGKIWESLDEQDKEKVVLYNDYDSLNPEELANLMIQVDEIMYTPFKYEGLEDEENVGRTVWEEFGYDCVYDNMTVGNPTINGVPISEYLDFERIGRDFINNGSIKVGDYGFVDLDGSTIDLKTFTRDEIKSQGREVFKKDKIKLISDRIKEAKIEGNAVRDLAVDKDISKEKAISK